MVKVLRTSLVSIINISAISGFAAISINTTKISTQDTSINNTLKITADLHRFIYVNSIATVLAQCPLTDTEKYCFLNAYNQDETFLQPLFINDFTPSELKELEAFFHPIQVKNP